MSAAWRTAAPLQRFALADLAPEPWRNGAGLTRPIAAGHDAHGLLWRASAADITADAPFSTFAGLDRHAVLLRGAGLTLTPPSDRADASRPSDPPGAMHFDAIGARRAFSGETALEARLAGAPAQLLNLMLRRDAARAEVAVHTCTTPGHGRRTDNAAAAPWLAELLLVLRGSLLVTHAGPAFTVASGAGLWQAGGFDAAQAWRAAQAQTCWVHLRIAQIA